MNFRILYIVLFLVFSSYTAYTLYISNQSLFSFGYQLLSSPDTAQVVIDLYIMGLLAIIWMYIDHKKQEKPIWYWAIFVLITLVFVSIGPLLYLVCRNNKGTTNET